MMNSLNGKKHKNFHNNINRVFYFDYIEVEYPVLLTKYVNNSWNSFNIMCAFLFCRVRDHLNVYFPLLQIQSCNESNIDHNYYLFLTRVHLNSMLLLVFYLITGLIETHKFRKLLENMWH